MKDRQAKHQWDDADEADFIKGAHDRFELPVLRAALSGMAEIDLSRLAVVQRSRASSTRSPSSRRTRCANCQERGDRRNRDLPLRS